MTGEAERARLHDDRWKILGVLAVVQFMLYLDDTIVNIALPSIRGDLDMSYAGLAWVVNAYVIAFGGFLLLGGRMADLLGQRRMLLLGITVFALASVVNALATSGEMLIASRAVQGLGSALVTPAAFSTVANVFSNPRERATAIALWSSLAGLGGATGVILSGVITTELDWRWIFWINPPIAAIGIVFIARRLAPEGRRLGRFDLPGALVSTAAAVVFVYTLLEANDRGWGSAWTLGGLALAAALAVAFTVVERRTDSPLVPLGFFRSRRRNAGVAVQYLCAAVLFCAFFLGTLYMQEVLGYSPMKTSLAWIAFFVGLFVAFPTGTQGMLRAGARPVVVGGLLVAAVGMLLFSGIAVDGEFWSDLALPMLVVGLGLGWAFVPLGVLALDGTDEEDSGLASGLIYTGQQIGGALGLAIFVSIATTRNDSLLEDGVAAGAAQVEGAQLAFLIAAGLCILGAVLAYPAIGRLRPEAPPEPLVIGAIPGDRPPEPS